MNIQGMEQMNKQLMDHVGKIIVGKDHTIELVMTAIIASGHVLLEDVPGTGKTMLAKSVASSLDCTFQRIQFTPDLLPSDLTGIHFLTKRKGTLNSDLAPCLPTSCWQMRLIGLLRVPSPVCWSVWRSGRLVLMVRQDSWSDLLSSLPHKTP